MDLVVPLVLLVQALGQQVQQLDNGVGVVLTALNHWLNSTRWQLSANRCCKYWPTTLRNLEG